MYLSYNPYLLNLIQEKECIPFSNKFHSCAFQLGEEWSKCSAESCHGSLTWLTRWLSAGAWADTVTSTMFRVHWQHTRKTAHSHTVLPVYGSLGLWDTRSRRCQSHPRTGRASGLLHCTGQSIKSQLSFEGWEVSHTLYVKFLVRVFCDFHWYNHPQHGRFNKCAGLPFLERHQCLLAIWCSGWQ